MNQRSLLIHLSKCRILDLLVISHLSLVIGHWVETRGTEASLQLLPLSPVPYPLSPVPYSLNPQS